MSSLQFAFLVAFCIVFKIPARVAGVTSTLYDYWRFKHMYHYIEYVYFGYKYTTCRSGPLNDLEGIGLLCEIKKRGGKVLTHRQATKREIENLIRLENEYNYENDDSHVIDAEKWGK